MDCIGHFQTHSFALTFTHVAIIWVKPPMALRQCGSCDIRNCVDGWHGASISALQTRWIQRRFAAFMGVRGVEAGLAVIASLFAIIQGGVWVINGVQNYRAKKILKSSGSGGFQSTSRTQGGGATTHVAGGSLSSAVPTLRPKAMPHSPHASSLLPPAAPTVGDQTGDSGIDSGSAYSNTSSMTSIQIEGATTPQEVVKNWQDRSRFMRFARGIWHAVLIAFLPFFAFLTPLGLAIAVLFPFRSSVADPTLYENGSGSSLTLALILVIPGFFAFRHRPTGSVHKWVRRICLVAAVLLAILFFCLIAFVEPSS